MSLEFQKEKWKVTKWLITLKSQIKNKKSNLGKQERTAKNKAMQTIFMPSKLLTLPGK